MNKQSAAQPGVDAQCTNNLKSIHRLFKIYLHHTGRALGFPTNLETIHLWTHKQEVFVCPADQALEPAKKGVFRTSYEIVNDPLKPALSGTAPGRIAIVAEQRPNHDGKRFVLFSDGSVKAFDEEQFERLKKNSFIDKE